jgi:hypothetical protein
MPWPRWPPSASGSPWSTECGPGLDAVVATLVADAARKRLKSLLPAHHIITDALLLNQPVSHFQEVETMNARYLFRYARYALAALASVGFGLVLLN